MSNEKSEENLIGAAGEPSNLNLDDIDITQNSLRITLGLLIDALKEIEKENFIKSKELFGKAQEIRGGYEVLPAIRYLFEFVQEDQKIELTTLVLQLPISESISKYLYLNIYINFGAKQFAEIISINANSDKDKIVFSKQKFLNIIYNSVGIDAIIEIYSCLLDIGADVKYFRFLNYLRSKNSKIDLVKMINFLVSKDIEVSFYREEKEKNDGLEIPMNKITSSISEMQIEEVFPVFGEQQIFIQKCATFKQQVSIENLIEVLRFSSKFSRHSIERDILLIEILTQQLNEDDALASDFLRVINDKQYFNFDEITTAQFLNLVLTLINLNKLMEAEQLYERFIDYRKRNSKSTHFITFEFAAFEIIAWSFNFSNQSSVLFLNNVINNNVTSYHEREYLYYLFKFNISIKTDWLNSILKSNHFIDSKSKEGFEIYDKLKFYDTSRNVTEWEVLFNKYLKENDSINPKLTSTGFELFSNVRDKQEIVKLIDVLNSRGIFPDTFNRYYIFEYCENNQDFEFAINLSIAGIDKGQYLSPKELTRIIRMTPPDKVQSLIEFIDFLESKETKFDSRHISSICEKLRYADNSDLMETFIEKYSTKFGPKIIYSYYILLLALTDHNQIEKCLELVNKIFELLESMGDDDKNHALTILKSKSNQIGNKMVVDLIDLKIIGFSNQPGLDPRPVDRIKVKIQYIPRSQKIVKTIKELYDNTCQVCETSIDTPSGFIIEAAHIKPLGSPHFGPDLLENLLCLCPNHHAALDKYGWYLDDDLNVVSSMSNQKQGKIFFRNDHTIGLSFIRYHRKIVLDHLTRVN